MDKNIITTQIRLCESLHEYVKAEAERLGISLNAAFISLLDEGRRFRESVIHVHLVESPR